MDRIPTLTLLGALMLAPPLAAQDAAYLSEVPTAQQVAQGLAVASPRETAARRYAALFALGNLVESLVGTGSPSAQERIASFRSMRNQVYQMEKQRDPVNYLLERCSQAYADSPAFQRELLDLYFTPGWQGTYGLRLDPRRWKTALAMAPGAKVTAASMTPPMVEECGAAPAPVGPRTAIATAPSKDPVERERAEARAILQAGDTVRALEAYKRIVAAYPSRSEGYQGLGVIYVARHDYVSALPAWQKVTELDPGDGTPLLLVGGSYSNLTRYPEARDVFVALTRMKAASPQVQAQAHYMLGLTYLKLGQRDSAIVSYRALTVLDTTFAGKLAARLNTVSVPTVTTAPVAANVPAAAPTRQDGSALRAEGKKYYEAKQYVKARASYEKLLRFDPNDGWALYELGKSLLMIEGDADTDSMVAVWKRAVALKPTDIELLLVLGDALYSWDPEVAYAAFQRVLDLKPDAVTQARAHAGMGWNYYFYLQFKDAVAEFQEAIRLDPANDEYLYDLGIVYAKGGAKDAAMEVFKQLTSRNRKMAQELLATINKQE